MIIAIIGGGASGLMAGGLLSKKGFKVVIFEKNYSANFTQFFHYKTTT